MNTIYSFLFHHEWPTTSIYAKLIMILNSLGHCTCPIVKCNTITQCPILVDCCVVVFWLVSLRRSPQSLVLDPADVTCVHILMWIAESMEANEASQPCNTTPAPSYVVSPRIRMVWLIVVFHFSLFISTSIPPDSPFFTSKSYEMGLRWSIKWSPPILHPRQSLSITDWLLCVLFWGKAGAIRWGRAPQATRGGYANPSISAKKRLHRD